ncbi:uncharacterized protein ACBR49_004752 [Aulostomus maculatus]
MTRCTRASLLLLVTFGWFARAEESNGSLELTSPQRVFSPAWGSSVRLSCLADYDFQPCGWLHVTWGNISMPNVELTDPDKFITTVNETGGDVRRRLVVTEILHLTPQDSGIFQCKAECEAGRSAIGHVIRVDVQGGKSLRTSFT